VFLGLISEDVARSVATAGQSVWKGGRVNAILLVLIFVSTDCPVSNRYAPDIQRLQRDFAPQGVRFELVYPNPADDAAAIARHLKEYGYPATIGTPDAAHRLAKSVGATITPEAAVLDANRRLIYRGRIDDRFVELGRERSRATTHDLRDALTASLAGKPVAPAKTQAVGCYIADMVPR
jgi:thiol-disulfide isomerase/thioredoxin